MMNAAVDIRIVVPNPDSLDPPIKGYVLREEKLNSWTGPNVLWTSGLDDKGLSDSNVLDQADNSDTISSLFKSKSTAYL